MERDFPARDSHKVIFPSSVPQEIAGCVCIVLVAT